MMRLMFDTSTRMHNAYKAQQMHYADETFISRLKHPFTISQEI